WNQRVLRCILSLLPFLLQKLQIQGLDQLNLLKILDLVPVYTDTYIFSLYSVLQPVKMMEDFLRLASKNTRKNLETCGVLVGSLKNRIFHITTLIIPKQESTSDLCLTLNNEEEIFEVQDNLSLFPLGWIH
ncbi:hypothetical protein S83_065999, partial [Arachis hypogaea]